MNKMLGRTFNCNTQCWENTDMVSIPAEQMDGIMRPGATFLDLMALLVWRDKHGVVKS